MSHRVLTAAAAAMRGTSASSAIIAAAPPPPAPAPAPAAATDDTVIDVVTLADYHAGVAAAITEGATAERARTSAVFASDAGKANPQMAAFMLNSNPGATADAIVAQLGSMPTAAAPAPAPAAAAPTPPAAPTADLTQTPTIDVGTAPNAGEAEPAVDANKFWDTQIGNAAASASKPFGADIAPGLPRTGN